MFKANSYLYPPTMSLSAYSEQVADCVRGLCSRSDYEQGEIVKGEPKNEGILTRAALEQHFPGEPVPGADTIAELLSRYRSKERAERLVSAGADQLAQGVQT